MVSSRQQQAVHIPFHSSLIRIRKNNHVIVRIRAKDLPYNVIVRIRAKATQDYCAIAKYSENFTITIVEIMIFRLYEYYCDSRFVECIST